MKIQTFEVKVAVPEYIEEISVDDLLDVLQQTGDEGEEKMSITKIAEHA